MYKLDLDDNLIKALNLCFDSAGYESRLYLLGLKHDKGACLKKIIKTDRLIDALKKTSLDENVNYYISHNIYKKNAKSHSDLNVFSLKNIVIDIDFHGLPDYDILTDHLIDILSNDWDGPLFNIINKTGRGVQLWWCINETSRSLEFLYKIIQKGIIDKVNELMNENKISLEGESVDESASGRVSGLFRLFNTVNTRTKTYGEIIIMHEDKYDINYLRDFYAPQMKEYAEAKASGTLYPSGKLSTSRTLYSSGELTSNGKLVPNNSSPAGGNNKYNNSSNKQTKPRHKNTGSVHYKRLLVIEELIKLRDLPDGDELRDLNLMHYYNEAVQYYDTKEIAIEKLIFVNRLFKRPLKQTQVDAITRCVDAAGNNLNKKNCYIYTNQKIIENLNISKEHQDLFNFYPVDEGVVFDKNAARDSRRKKRREERDFKIIDLYKKDLSSSHIAEIVNCHKKTVDSVILKYTKRAKDKIRETMEVLIMLKKVMPERRLHSKFIKRDKLIRNIKFSFNKLGLDILFKPKPREPVPAPVLTPVSVPA